MNLTPSGRTAVLAFEEAVTQAWKTCLQALLNGGLESVTPATDLASLPPFEVRQFAENWLRNTAAWAFEQQRLLP